MPRMDSTGPYGNGPVGMGLGPCGSREPGPRSGRWFSHRAFRHGYGPGWRGAPSFSSPDEEKAYLEGAKSFLEQRKNWLETQIENITQRIESLAKPKEA
ncbi:MAG: DUF5320 domain-containing protein [Chloroflexi bacterium]|nr:DUF5320 domain-containing protein [Chloroflexota bacterium]